MADGEVAGVEASELMDLSTVAAHNIIAVLGLPEESLEATRSAIKDEIDSISTHFAMLIADMQSAHAAEIDALKVQYVTSTEAIPS